MSLIQGPNTPEVTAVDGSALTPCRVMDVALGQNLIGLVNIKIAEKWVFTLTLIIN